MPDNRIYKASGPMEPVALMGEKLRVYNSQKWMLYEIQALESLMLSSQTRVNLGAIATGATIAATLVTALRASEDELLQFRLKPVDDVELIIWSPGAPENATAYVRTRISKQEGQPDVDPFWAMTERFVLGTNLDFNIEARNTTGYNLAQCRIDVWGYRFRLGAIREQPGQNFIATRVVADAIGISRPAV